MKKPFLFTCFLTLFFLNVNGQAFEWAKTLHVTAPNSLIFPTPQVVSDGTDIISAGEINGTLTIGNQTITSANFQNSYLAKLDKTSNLIWVRILNGATGDLKVKADLNKNII